MPERLPMDVDPWDETPVTTPRGLLALLLNAAGKADEARLLGECPSDPCPSCTALVEIHEAVYPSADEVVQGSASRPDIGVDVQPTPIPEAAPAVWMDQRGNYWRVFPKGTLPGADEDMLSMCPTSSENYRSEPVAIYRQGRDLSAQQMRELLARIDGATEDLLLDDLLLRKAADSAWQAWTTGRDMVTEAELLIEMVATRLGVREATNGT